MGHTAHPNNTDHFDPKAIFIKTIQKLWISHCDSIPIQWGYVMNRLPVIWNSFFFIYMYKILLAYSFKKFLDNFFVVKIAPATIFVPFCLAVLEEKIKINVQ